MRRTLVWIGLGMVALGWPLFAGEATPAPAPVRCAASDVAVDVDHDGREECVRITRVGDEAWFDVRSADGTLRSTTRVARLDGDLLAAADGQVLAAADDRARLRR